MLVEMTGAGWLWRFADGKTFSANLQFAVYVRFMSDGRVFSDIKRGWDAGDIEVLSGTMKAAWHSLVGGGATIWSRV